MVQDIEIVKNALVKHGRTVCGQEPMRGSEQQLVSGYAYSQLAFAPGEFFCIYARSACSQQEEQEFSMPPCKKWVAVCAGGLKAAVLIRALSCQGSPSSVGWIRRGESRHCVATLRRDGASALRGAAVHCDPACCKWNAAC